MERFDHAETKGEDGSPRELKEVFQSYSSQPVHRVVYVVNPILQRWAKYGPRHRHIPKAAGNGYSLCPKVTGPTLDFTIYCREAQSSEARDGRLMIGPAHGAESKRRLWEKQFRADAFCTQRPFPRATTQGSWKSQTS